MKKKLYVILSLLAVFVFVLAACGGSTSEATNEMVGTPEHPIKILFVPSVDATEILTGADLLVAQLSEATGYTFEASVPSSYAATIEEMCASPTDTMGFIPGLGYVLANQLCGVDVGAKAERYGYTFYTAIVVVQRDSPYQTLADLNGLKWAYPDTGSTSGYLFPTYAFQQEGIVPGEVVEAGSHDNAVRMVYNGEADFGTVFYSPPRVDGVAVDWTPPEFMDVPADLLDSCATTEDGGKLLCGNFEIRDARRNIRKEVPDAAQKLRIMYSTPVIPNDTVSFGPDFDAEMRANILQALYDFAANDPDGFGEALSPYSWTNVVPATDAEYDPIRFGVEAVGYSLEDLSE